VVLSAEDLSSDRFRAFRVFRGYRILINHGTHGKHGTKMKISLVAMNVPHSFKISRDVAAVLSDSCLFD
jgi:hypothetical protein